MHLIEIFNIAILRCKPTVESVVYNRACCVIPWNTFDNKIKRTVWHATCPILSVLFYGLDVFCRLVFAVALALAPCYYVHV